MQKGLRCEPHSGPVCKRVSPPIMPYMKMKRPTSEAAALRPKAREDIRLPATTTDRQPSLLTSALTSGPVAQPTSGNGTLCVSCDFTWMTSSAGAFYKSLLGWPLFYLFFLKNLLLAFFWCPLIRWFRKYCLFYHSEKMTKHCVWNSTAVFVMLYAVQPPLQVI